VKLRTLCHNPSARRRGGVPPQEEEQIIDIWEDFRDRIRPAPPLGSGPGNVNDQEGREDIDEADKAFEDRARIGPWTRARSG
jgi:hypothetical protein